MFYAFPYVFAVLVVCERACRLAYGAEFVCAEIFVAYFVHYLLYAGSGFGAVECYECHFVTEVLENYYVPV